MYDKSKATKVPNIRKSSIVNIVKKLIL